MAIDACTLDFWLPACMPLLRLLLGLGLGIFFAQILESFHYISRLAKFAKPIAKHAHFGCFSQAAFSSAFLSPSTSNALLAKAYQEKKISHRELFLASLFASFPAYLVHIPTLFFLIFPVLGFATLIYVGLSLVAAFFRTFCIFLLAKKLLPLQQEEIPLSPTPKESSKPSFSEALFSALKKCRRRLPKVFVYTVPIYLLVFYLQSCGAFEQLRLFLIQQNFWADFISPQAFGIVFLHLLAELGSALGAATSLLASGGLSEKEVIGALLIGNILSTPIRALRHQLPSYIGLYSPSIGAWLVVANQFFRFISMCLVAIVYFVFCAFFL